MTKLWDQVKELHRGHNCETWNLLLEDSAERAVIRATQREDELCHGTKQTVPGGHEFYLDEDGDIDSWHFDGDTHNGPGCAVCDDSWCQHCHRTVYTEQCPGR